jgi:hypothetical protein
MQVVLLDLYRRCSDGPWMSIWVMLQTQGYVIGKGKRSQGMIGVADHCHLRGRPWNREPLGRFDFGV